MSEIVFGLLPTLAAAEWVSSPGADIVRTSRGTLRKLHKDGRQGRLGLRQLVSLGALPSWFATHRAGEMMMGYPKDWMASATPSSRKSPK
jgi:hypothetical protein